MRVNDEFVCPEYRICEKKMTTTRRKNTDDRLAKKKIKRKKNARPLRNSMYLFIAEYH